MIYQQLKDKRVLITAGGQGIGLAISRLLLETGCRVAIHYYSSDQAVRELAAEYSKDEKRVVPLQADLTDPNQIAPMVEAAASQLGGIDIAINNAGSLVERRSLKDCDPAFTADLIHLNLDSAIQVTRTCLPHLLRATPASIINVASLAGRKGGHGGSLIYATAKGALITFTRALANELGPDGIRVNAVAPGLILGTSFHNTHTTAVSAQATIADIPLQRAGTPEDVARAVLFLASEYNGFIQGVTLDINGGTYVS